MNKHTARTLVAVLMLAVDIVPSYARKPNAPFESSVSSKATPWSHLKFATAQGSVRFAIMSDRTGGHRPGVFGRAIERVNRLQPEFVMCVGDLIEGYTDDTARVRAEWDELDSLIAPLSMPFFRVGGNHDLTNAAMRKIWKERYGPTHYEFVYKEMLFLVLDSHDSSVVEGTNGISPKQHAFVKKTLKRNRNVKWTFVFMHHPLWLNSDSTALWFEIEKVLPPNKHSVFAGHLHNYGHYPHEGGDYYVLATTGGGSELFGPMLGKFDHVVWVAMAGDKPVVTNLLLEGIWDDRVVPLEQQREVAGLFEGAGVVFTPLPRPGKQFSAGSTAVRLANTSDFPMTVRLEILTDTLLTCDPAFCRTLLEPGAALERMVTLSSAKPVPVDLIDPIDVVSRIEIDHPMGAGGIEKTFGNRLWFEDLTPLGPTTRPVRVDGELGEWDTLPIVCDTACRTKWNGEWKGTWDASFRFGVTYNDSFLYVGVKVRDDVRVTAPEGHRNVPWHEDGLEIRLDARPDPLRSSGRGGGEMTRFHLFALCPRDRAEDTKVHAASDLPRGSRAVCLNADDGYRAEVAVPISYVTERQGDEWERVRINVAVGDFDGKPGDYSTGIQLWWRPDWRDKENWVGSGTFVRMR